MGRAAIEIGGEMDGVEVGSGGLRYPAFVVVVESLIHFRTEDLGEAMAFHEGRGIGAIYGRVLGESAITASPVLPCEKRVSGNP
jgi:hypothetical protein